MKTTAIILSTKNVKRVRAIDTASGTQYEVGTTKVFDRYGELVTEFTNYTFELRNINVSKTAGKFTFSVWRCRQWIGDHTTMHLQVVLEGED